MPEADRVNSFSCQLRPSRVNFFYIYPIQKCQQEVQDPETPPISQGNYDKSHESQDKNIKIASKSQQKSSGFPTTLDSSSEYNSFLSISIQLPKIRKKYLDDFIFLKNLGKGTYGRVQKLKGKMDHEIYAGKTLLKTPNSSQNRYKNKKLQDEICIYQKLNHPNIPQLHQIYTWKNQYTLILDFAEGHSLHAVCKHYSKEQQIIARIMYQIFDTLEYLQLLNIVHHDIKPQNIIYDPYTQLIRIFDFGEAIQLTTSSQTIMDQGGTLAYFAPECMKGLTTTKIDVWAAGLVLFYLLSGDIYFYDAEKTQMKKKILEKEVLFEGHYWRQKSESVKDLIMKLLQKDYSKRISARQAKNHPWIIEHTQDWVNPATKILKGMLETMRRSCSIDKKIGGDAMGVGLETRSPSRGGSHNKLSRFCESAQSTLSRS